MKDILTDKKLIVSSLLSIAILFLIFLIAGYLNLPFQQERIDEPCFIMVPEEYCRTGVMISYLGNDAIGFNLPAGTAIYAPYDGAFFEDIIIYEDELETIEAESPIRAKFGIPETTSFVIFVGEHAPFLKSGGGITAGQHVANMSVLASDRLIHEESNSNFVVYTTDYDLSLLFK